MDLLLTSAAVPGSNGAYQHTFVAHLSGPPCLHTAGAVGVVNTVEQSASLTWWMFGA